MLVAWSPASPGDTSGDSQVSRQLVAPPLVALDLPSWQTAARDSPPVVTSHQELNTVLTTVLVKGSFCSVLTSSSFSLDQSSPATKSSTPSLTTVLVKGVPGSCLPGRLLVDSCVGPTASYSPVCWLTRIPKRYQLFNLPGHRSGRRPPAISTTVQCFPSVSAVSSIKGRQLLFRSA